MSYDIALVSSGYDMTIRFWSEISSGTQCKYTVEHKDNAINALEMTPAKDKVAFASGNSIEDMGKFQCSLQKKEATDNKKRTHKIVCTIKGTYERRNRND